MCACIPAQNEGNFSNAMKFDAQCSFEGELNILFVGGLEDVLNLASAAFSSNVMSLIATSVSNLLVKNS